MYTQLVGQHSQLYMVFFVGSLAALITYTITSLLYTYILDSIRNVLLIYVFYIIESIIRNLYYIAYKKFKRNFLIVDTNAVSRPLIDVYIALCSGIGYGFVCSILLFGYLLFSSTYEPALFPSGKCSERYSTFLDISFLCLFINFSEPTNFIFTFYTNNLPRNVFYFVQFILYVLEVSVVVLSSYSYNNDICYAVPFLVGVSIFIYIFGLIFLRSAYQKRIFYR